MRSIILYIATSLNGKIARADGSVDWLESIPNPDQLDYGYTDFYASIDTTIIGGATFRQLQSWDINWPYSGATSYIISRQAAPSALPKDVHWLSEQPLEFIRQLKMQPGKNVWLVGGGQINTLFLQAGLIDEIRLFVMPIILPDGLDLFPNNPPLQILQLTHSQPYPTGVLELHFSLKT